MVATAVLIPAYNCQPKLNETCASLPVDLPLAVFVVDDGSDPPIDLPRVSSCHSLHLVRLSKNSGIHEALRVGVKVIAARGFRYIARLDAGDKALGGRFAKQVNFLESNHNVAVVGSYVRFDITDQNLARGTSHAPGICIVPICNKGIKAQRFIRACLIHPAVMMRMSAVIDVGNYRHNYPAAEDLDLFVRIMRKYDCANIPEVLTACEISGTGISAQHRRTQLHSTLMLQVRHLRVTSLYDWASIIKTLVFLALPASMAVSLKRLLRA